MKIDADSRQNRPFLRGATWMFAAALFASTLAGCGSGEDADPATSGTLYTVNADGSIASCTVAASGMPNDCDSTSAGDKALGSAGIAVFGTHAYITNLATNSIKVCEVGKVNPETSCSDFADASISQPFGIAFSGSNGYIVNANDTVTRCTVASDGTLSNCAIQNTGALLSSAAGITISGSHAYIVNQGSDTVAVCVVGADGSLSGCATSGSNLAAPTGIAVANGYAYLTNTANSSLGVCPLDANGNLQACAEIDGNGAFRTPSSITLNGSIAYITNMGDESIATCKVNGGAVDTCLAGSADGVFYQTTGSTFSGAKS